MYSVRIRMISRGESANNAAAQMELRINTYVPSSDQIKFGKGNRNAYITEIEQVTVSST